MSQRPQRPPASPKIMGTRPPSPYRGTRTNEGSASPTDRGTLAGVGTAKWDVRFLNLATELARWSSCRRDQVGAVIASPDHDVVATGFNDTPAGWANCGDGGCPRACRPHPSGSPQLDDEVCLHAEGNALQRAGLRARGAVMYVTRQPCAVCHRIALTAGIARIVVKETA